LLMAGHSTQTERDVRPNKRVECPDKPRARRTGPNGLFLPFGKVIKRFDSERIERLIWKITRGLNFHHHPRFGPRIGKSLGRLIIHVRTLSHLNISNTSCKCPITSRMANMRWSLVTVFSTYRQRRKMESAIWIGQRIWRDLDWQRHAAPRSAFIQLKAS